MFYQSIMSFWRRKSRKLTLFGEFEILEYSFEWFSWRNHLMSSPQKHVVRLTRITQIASVHNINLLFQNELFGNFPQNVYWITEYWWFSLQFHCVELYVWRHTVSSPDTKRPILYCYRIFIVCSVAASQIKRRAHY